MTRFQLIALDLDGTLLNSEHVPSNATVEYLQQLAARGFQIMIATGRAAHTVYDTVRTLDLPYDVPVICSNGAKGLILTPDATPKELFSTPVPLEVTHKVIQLAREMNHVVQYYFEDEIYANPSIDPHYVFTKRYTELTGSQTIYVETDYMLTLTNKGLPSKLLVFCSTDEMPAVYDKLYEHLSDQATLIKGTPGGWFVEILNPSVCKGAGLKRMCEHLKIPIEKCLSFGDGDNDKEFLQWSGHGVAMKNARETVKAVADEIIEYTNDEDGVIQTIKRYESERALIFD